MYFVSEGISDVMDPVTENPHTFRSPTILVTSWIDRGAGNLRKLSWWYVGRTWDCRMNNTLWQEFVGGGGISKPPYNALLGVKDSP